MRAILVTLFIATLSGCASAPIVAEGGGRYSIGDSGKDRLHRDTTNWRLHAQRADNFCRTRGQTYRYVDVVPSDDKFHFACETPPPPPPLPAPASETELDAARTNWRSCLEVAEPPIDDMISDANTVATILATRCSPEFDVLLELTQKGHPYHAPASAFQPVRHQVALDVVLRVRAQRRNPKAMPPPIVIPRLTPEKF